MKEELKRNFEIETNKFYQKHESLYIPELDVLKFASTFNTDVARVIKPMDYDIMLFNHNDLKKVVINPDKKKILTPFGEKLAIVYGVCKILYAKEDKGELEFINIEKDNFEYYLAKCFILPEDLLIRSYHESNQISSWIENLSKVYNYDPSFVEERVEDASSYGQRGKIRLRKINLNNN